MTTMPAFDARKLDLPIPSTGVAPRPARPRGPLRPAPGRIVGMDPTEFVFPCYFLGDPNIQPPQRGTCWD